MTSSADLDQPPKLGAFPGGSEETWSAMPPKRKSSRNQLNIGQFAGRLTATSSPGWVAYCKASEPARAAQMIDLDVAICKTYACHASDRIKGQSMKRVRTAKVKSVTSKSAARSISSGVVRRASIFQNGANQAVRLPQEMRFPTDVKEVRIRKQGDGLVITPVKPNWASFFALQTDVPDDFLGNRSDSNPQSRDPL
jgi:antitoxin VapB